MNVSKQEKNTTNAKTKVFIYWEQGFEGAPGLVRACLKSWRQFVQKHSSALELVELSNDIVNQYINISEEITNFDTSLKITRTSRSDIIRIFLLEKYGGVWVDATLFCNTQARNWFEDIQKQEFFAFQYLNTPGLISSWFLFAAKNSYIVHAWKRDIVKYINTASSSGQHIGQAPSVLQYEKWQKNHFGCAHYFWMHYIFRDLYNTDHVFRKIVSSVPKKDTKFPHYIQSVGFNSTSFSTKAVQETSTVYKLSYKVQWDCTKNNVLKYLLASYM